MTWHIAQHFSKAMANQYSSS